MKYIGLAHEDSIQTEVSIHPVLTHLWSGLEGHRSESVPSFQEKSCVIDNNWNTEVIYLTSALRVISRILNSLLSIIYYSYLLLLLLHALS